MNSTILETLRTTADNTGHPYDIGVYNQTANCVAEILQDYDNRSDILELCDTFNRAIIRRIGDTDISTCLSLAMSLYGSTQDNEQDAQQLQQLITVYLASMASLELTTNIRIQL